MSILQKKMQLNSKSFSAQFICGYVSLKVDVCWIREPTSCFNSRPLAFRYPRYRRLPRPDLSAGNGCLPSEGGIQHQHDDHESVQNNAGGRAASLQGHATPGCAVHEPRHCQGFHHWGEDSNVFNERTVLKGCNANHTDEEYWHNALFKEVFLPSSPVFLTLSVSTS